MQASTGVMLEHCCGRTARTTCICNPARCTDPGLRRDDVLCGPANENGITHRHADAGRHPRQAAKSVMCRVCGAVVKNSVIPAQAGTRASINRRDVEHRCGRTARTTRICNPARCTDPGLRRDDVLCGPANENSITHHHADAGRHPRQAAKSVMCRVCGVVVKNSVIPAQAGTRASINRRDVEHRCGRTARTTCICNPARCTDPGLRRDDVLCGPANENSITHRHADAGRHPRQAAKSVMCRVCGAVVKNSVIPAQAGTRASINRRDVEHRCGRTARTTCICNPARCTDPGLRRDDVLCGPANENSITHRHADAGRHPRQVTAHENLRPGACEQSF